MSAIPPTTWLEVVFGCILAVLIFQLAIIDIQRMILPDGLTLVLAAIGIAQSLIIGRPKLFDSVLGALIGAVVFELLANLFRYVRGIEGLGRGDRKFVAAAGLWVGWQQLGLMMFIAATSALLFVTFQAIRNDDLEWSARIPFGPFLGLGTFATWLAALANW